ncbi:MAG: acetyl-CoA C-acetyltransferase [Patescibacteria group bacterium]
MKKRVFIVDGLRTPFLKASGPLSPFSASDLAVYAARPLFARMPFEASEIDEVIIGCVGQPAAEQNIARVIALRLGCGKYVPAYTVHRNCASGLQALANGYDAISSGRADLILAGGTEAMSHSPIQYSQKMADWFAKFSRAKSVMEKIKLLTRLRLSYLKPVITLLLGLFDSLYNMSMGQTAEKVAYRFGITRKEQDEFALESHKKLAAAQDAGLLKEEITPIFDSRGNIYTEDNGLRRDSTMKGLAKPKPAFDKKYGTVTPGNSSQITDGAAMLILASEEAVKKYNLPVLGEIIDYAFAGVDPTEIGLGPVNATAKLLVKNNLAMDDIGQVELNEAFAAQALGCQAALESEDYAKKELGLEKPLGKIKSERLNPEGGAIAMGHPVGASGARIILHLARVLKNKELGVATLCIGGGQGGAMLIRALKSPTCHLGRQVDKRGEK